MNCQHWIIAGILLASIGLWVLIRHGDARRKSRMPVRHRRSGGQGTAPPGQPSESSQLALELAESYLQHGETEVARRYVDEVLATGSEAHAMRARQLLKKLSDESSAV